MSAQLIDDDTSTTVIGMNDEVLKDDKLKGVSRAEAFGKTFGEAATKAGASSVIFDRGSFRYHGRVKAFADAARAAGLQF